MSEQAGALGTRSAAGKIVMPRGMFECLTLFLLLSALPSSLVSETAKPH